MLLSRHVSRLAFSPTIAHENDGQAHEASLGHLLDLVGPVALISVGSGDLKRYWLSGCGDHGCGYLPPLHC